MEPEVATWLAAEEAGRMCLGAFGARSPSPPASSRALEAGPRGACGFGGEDNLISLCVPRNLGELPSDYRALKAHAGNGVPKDSVRADASGGGRERL